MCEIADAQLPQILKLNIIGHDFLNLVILQGVFSPFNIEKVSKNVDFLAFEKENSFFVPSSNWDIFASLFLWKLISRFFFFLHFFEDFSILWFISWCPNPRAFYIVYQQPAAPIDIAHLTSKFVIIHQLWMVVNFFLAMPGRIAISSFCLD